MTFAEVLAKYQRIAIAGGPKVGKSTLSNAGIATGHRIVHTDDLISRFSWDDAPLEIISICSKLPRFVVEGVQVPRALRKGLAVDVVVWLGDPKAPQTDRQVSMGKGVKTVLDDWRANFNPAGIPVVTL